MCSKYITSLHVDFLWCDVCVYLYIPKVCLINPPLFLTGNAAAAAGAAPWPASLLDWLRHVVAPAQGLRDGAMRHRGVQENTDSTCGVILSLTHPNDAIIALLMSSLLFVAEAV